MTIGAAPAKQPAPATPDPTTLPQRPASAPDRVSASNSRGSTWRSLLTLRPYVAPQAGPLALSGVAALFATIAGLMIPLVVEHLVNDLGDHASGRRITGLALAIAALGSTEALLVLMRRRIIAFPTTQVEKRMREDLYAHLQKLGMTFHDRYQSGQLLSRAFSDLSSIRRFVAFGGIYLVVNGLTIVLGAGILLTLSVPLGLVVVVMTVPMFALSFLYESRFRVVARRSQDQVGDLATLVEESVLGIRVLKSFGRGGLMADRFRQDASELRRTEIRKVDIISAIWATIIALPELALGAILVIGAVEVAHHSISVGTLVAAVTAMTYLIWPIESIGFLLADANNCATAADRFWEVMHTEPTIADAPAGSQRRLPDPVCGELRFEDVHFTYPSGADPSSADPSSAHPKSPDPSSAHPKSPDPSTAGPRQDPDPHGGGGRPDHEHIADPGTEVLRGIDLTVRPGETLALVGLSGSGKTTLTSLVPRLYDVTSGRITLDGVDLRELSLDELRSRVATAFEEPVLFSASVRENVALGLGDVEDEVVEQALRIASATDFTSRLPWGLDTRIGEQGLSLSGGQRQRLALARAVAGRPAVLVLDDPLSALDVHTEAEVERALRRVLSGVTALVVAHRPSTVSLADRVALIADGRVAAIGRHSDLMATSPAYRNVLSSLDEEELAAHGDTPAGTVGVRS